jgi:hypothetical protein
MMTKGETNRKIVRGDSKTKEEKGTVIGRAM